MTATPPPISARMVPLSSLRLDHRYWSNPRVHSGLDEQSIADLGADLKVRNIQVPLVVQQVKSNGSVLELVLEGQRRVNAAQLVFPKNHLIPVIDRTPEPIELTPEIADKILLDMLSVGARREGLSSYELSESAERLRNRGRTLLEIGNAIGKSESWVSKILKARAAATPKLMLQWRKGLLTEEQFKDLAAVSASDQEEDMKKVIEARKSGDKGEARTIAKEIKATKAPGKHATNSSNGNGKHVVKGPQVDMFDEGKGKSAEADVSFSRAKEGHPDKRAERAEAAADKRAEAHKRTAPSKTAIEELVHLSTRRPPTHDYVKGLMDAARWVLGEIGPDKFGKPWSAYLARIDGSGKAKKTARPPRGVRTGKAAKKAAKARRAKVKAAKATKAKTRR